MRPSLACLVVAAAAAATLLLPTGPAPRAIAQDLHGDAEPLADPGALFREQCASCHVTPDPRVATDLAFIRQLQETA